MNITVICKLIILIKWKKYVLKIIKGPAKLSIAHWLKVLACTNWIYMFVSIQNIASDNFVCAVVFGILYLLVAGFKH
jgi:hypothetical protein